MIKFVTKNWISIKIVGITSLCFIVLIVSSVAWFSFRAFKRVEDKLVVCQNNIEQITKQYGNTRIILEQEKE